MKPASFDYHRPRSLGEALDLLARHGGEARVLAGGQSLVPAMNFRLARPGILVDINGLGELAGVREERGALAIGALTRHVVFEKPVAAGPLASLLPRVARLIAHLPIRVRGTFGGSLAHADPSAEWCTVALGLGATIEAGSATEKRVIEAADFFKTMFTTDLRDGEMILAVRLPLLDETWRCGFAEFSRRAGDFAIVSAFAAFRLDDGLIGECRIALGGVVDRPVRAYEAETMLQGERPSKEAYRAAADIAGRSFEPMGDIHGSAHYKSELVPVMTRRALEQALTP